MYFLMRMKERKGLIFMSVILWNVFNLLYYYFYKHMPKHWLLTDLDHLLGKFSSSRKILKMYLKASTDLSQWWHLSSWFFLFFFKIETNLYGTRKLLLQFIRNKFVQSNSLFPGNKGRRVTPWDMVASWG